MKYDYNINLEYDDEADGKCPWCGAEREGYDDLTFTSYRGCGCGIEVTCHCDECGADYALVYHLGEAVRFDD